MKRLVTTLCLLSLTLVVVAADGRKKAPDTRKLVAASDKQGLTYAKDIKPMLEVSCIKCHGADKTKGGFRVDSLDRLIKGGESEEAAVVAGQSARSPMVWYVSELVEEMEMPPLDKREKNKPLTKAQIADLRAWIDQGAK